MGVKGSVSEARQPQDTSHLSHSFTRKNKTVSNRMVQREAYDVVEGKPTACDIYRKARSTSEPHNEPVTQRPSQGR